MPEFLMRRPNGCFTPIMSDDAKNALMQFWEIRQEMPVVTIELAVSLQLDTVIYIDDFYDTEDDLFSTVWYWGRYWRVIKLENGKLDLESLNINESGECACIKNLNEKELVRRCTFMVYENWDDTSPSW